MKAEWKNGNYGLMFLELGMFRATVMWDSCQSKGAPDEDKGYQVRFEDVTLKKHFKSADEAKVAAVNLAYRKLTEALDMLKTLSE